jgi:hypothetical protein
MATIGSFKKTGHDYTGQIITLAKSRRWVTRRDSFEDELLRHLPASRDSLAIA